jgi:hypothetical protein
MLVDDDHADGEAVLESILANAAPEFTELVRFYIGEKFTEKSIFNDVLSGRWLNPHEAIAPLPDLLYGLVLYLEDSQYLYANLGDAEVYISTPGTTTEELSIIDLDKGTVIETISFDGSAIGYKRIPIGKKYFGARRIFVGVPLSLGGRRTTLYSKAYFDSLCESCGCSASWASCANLDSTGTLTYSDLNFENCGLILTYGIGCSLDQWICANRARLAYPFKQLVAMETFDRILGSKKLNSSTLIDKEELGQLRTLSKDKLERSLNTIAAGASFSCKVCLPCAKKKTKRVYLKP